MNEKCKKHPKYKALRRPIADCDCCWRIWEKAQRRRNRQEDVVTEAPL